MRRVIVIGIVALLVVVAALPAVAKVANVSKSGDRNDDRWFAAQVEYFPTSKEQCKKGGWKNFTTAGFKNQGDCVSYVATGGKNPPSGAE